MISSSKTEKAAEGEGEEDVAAEGVAAAAVEVVEWVEAEEPVQVRDAAVAVVECLEEVFSATEDQPLIKG